MKLSQHFTLEELLVTEHKDLRPLQKEEVKPYMTNLYVLCNFILEPIRTYYGKAITVTSGFRGKKLNTRVGGNINSDHCRGLAADIIVKGKTVDEVFKDIISGKIGIIYRQVINEKHSWIHIASLRFPFNKDDKYLDKLITEDGKTYKKII